MFQNEPNRTKGVLFTCARCGVTEFSPFTISEYGNVKDEDPKPPTKWTFYSHSKGYLCPFCSEIWTKYVNEFFNKVSFS